MWWTRCIPIRLRCWNNRPKMGKYSDVLVALAETITSSNFDCVGDLLPRHHAVATASIASLPGNLLSKSCFEICRADVYLTPSHLYNVHRTGSGKSCSTNTYAEGLIGAQDVVGEASKTALSITSETRPKRASPCPFPPTLYHLNTFPSAYTFSHFRDVSDSLTLSSSPVPLPLIRSQCRLLAHLLSYSRKGRSTRRAATIKAR